MKIFKFFFVAVLFFLFQNSFALSAEKSYGVYVTNNTNYPVHILKSLYTETPFDILVQDIPPLATEVQIGKATMVNNTTKIAFMAQIGDEQEFWNTPLVIYSLS